ncbi:MAG: Hsp70 family protein [Mycobacteriaceae bacterium]|nr:Hsp70 family protein [Mycobacteriaceae bacterium]
MGNPAAQGWLFSVDFGTSNTAAAHVAETSGTVQPLPLSHGGNLISSAVYVGQSGQIEVGEVALNNAAADPAGFIAAPKRSLSLGQPTFRVGAGEVPAHLVVAGVLRTALTKAQAQHGGKPPAGIVLTHPEEWLPPQVQILTDAANSIGFPAELVRTVSEPRAAAFYYARGGSVRPGDKVAVYDFGGGTLDVAVLSAGEDGNFNVIAAGGDNALGGRNFDAIIRRWAERQLEDEAIELLDAIRGGRLSSREAWELDDSIRRAKEVLSESAQASIEVAAGPHHAVLWLSRDEFEQLIAAEVTRAVELAQSVLRIVGVGGVSAVYMTGGSSRIPAVRRAIGSLGSVATLDDPKTVVAQGALIAVTKQEEATGAAATAGAGARPGRDGVRSKQSWAFAGAGAVVGAVLTAILMATTGVGVGESSDAAPKTVYLEPGDAVKALMPAQMRNVVRCQEELDDATDSKLGIRSFKCRPTKNKEPLFAGLTKSDYGSVLITAKTSPDPAGRVNYMTNYKPSSTQQELVKVRDDAVALIVKKSYSSSNAVDLEYGNSKTGLYIQILDCKDKNTILTFLSRAGL